MATTNIKLISGAVWRLLVGDRLLSGGVLMSGVCYRPAVHQDQLLQVYLPQEQLLQLHLFAGASFKGNSEIISLD